MSRSIEWTNRFISESGHLKAGVDGISTHNLRKVIPHYLLHLVKLQLLQSHLIGDEH